MGQVTKETDKKQLLLRLAPSLWESLVKWAEDDFRSVNGQIEYLLTESVRKRKRLQSIQETKQSDTED